MMRAPFKLTARWLASVAGALAGAGCGPDLPAQSDVQFDRPLGAWARVVGDEQRATPRPGERVRYTLAVVRPEARADDDDLRSMFLVCTAPEQFTGVPICQEFIDGSYAPGDAMGMAMDMAGASGGPPGGGAGLDIACGDTPFDMAFGPFGLACVQGTPEIEFAVEDDFTAKKKFVIGVVCERSEPYITDGSESTLISCRERPGEEPGEVMPVYGTVAVSQGDDGDNLNPDAGQLTITLGDALWVSAEGNPDLPAPLPPTGCAELAEDDPSLPTLSQRAKAPTLYFANPVDALERTPEGIEPLILAAHTTSGDIGRYYSGFGEDPKEVEKLSMGDGFELSDFEYTPDGEADTGEGGKLVRFFFTLRDGRGGFDMTERDLCLVP